MKLIKRLCATVLSAACACMCFAGCTNRGKSTLLAAPAAAAEFTYLDASAQNFSAVQKSANAFAAKFSQAVYSDYDGENNLAVSPVSVYMALALASVCTDGDTQAQLLSALDTTGEELLANFAYLYRSLNDDFSSGKISATNSVWLQQGPEFIEECINSLAGDYYCYPYAADFRGDNLNANAALSYFIKEATEGLIDQDFDLDEDTCFALVNTLCLKDAWNTDGDDLPFTEDMTFVREDGSLITKPFLCSYYEHGRAQSGENFSTFFTQTHNGFKIKFILPDDGVRLSDVFTEQTITYVNSLSDYKFVDEEKKEMYYTRCLFPEFEGDYDGDVKNILKSSFGIEDFFVKGECNLSSILVGSVDDRGLPVYCTRVHHTAKLKVNKTGVEGAAVTIIVNASEGADVNEYKNVYYDFEVNRDFGYVISDSYGTILFTGTVNNI